VESLNPVEWFEWIYGKWFVGHPWRGFLTLAITSCVVLSLIIGALWLRAMDKYAEKQPPKQQAVTMTDSSAQSVAARASETAEPNKAKTAIAARPRHVKRSHPSASLPKMQSSSQTPEIPINSVVENAGRINRMEISHAQVIAPPNGIAKVMQNLPGSESSDVKIDSPVVSSAPNSPTTPTATVTAPHSTGVLSTSSSDVVLEGNTTCGSTNTLLRTQGTANDYVITDSTIGNEQKCRWHMVIIALSRHREEIGSAMDRMSDDLDRRWANVPNGQKDKYRKSLAEMRKRLLDASSDKDTFSKALNDLDGAPPMFYLPD
jgi:hypothetical protein